MLKSGGEKLWNGCNAPNKTFYVSPGQEKVKVKLVDKVAVTFHLGEHEIEQTIGSTVCTYYIVILSKFVFITIEILTDLYVWVIWMSVFSLSTVCKKVILNVLVKEKHPLLCM